jgi:hypothetical protein
MNRSDLGPVPFKESLIMRNVSRIVGLAAVLAAATPFAANAAPHSLFTPSAKLVQEINNSYGTSFKVPAPHATMAARHQAPAQRAG